MDSEIIEVLGTSPGALLSLSELLFLLHILFLFVSLHKIVVSLGKLKSFCLAKPKKSHITHS